MKRAFENSQSYFLPANQLRRKMCCAKRFRNLERLFHRILAKYMNLHNTMFRSIQQFLNNQCELDVRVIACNFWVFGIFSFFSNFFHSNSFIVERKVKKIYMGVVLSLDYHPWLVKLMKKIASRPAVVTIFSLTLGSIKNKIRIAIQ